jgi:hypothetical protein
MEIDETETEIDKKRTRRDSRKHVTFDEKSTISNYPEAETDEKSSNNQIEETDEQSHSDY